MCNPVVGAHGTRNLCRGGPLCPPVLVVAQYDLWADTQVRPYNELVLSL